MSSLSAAPLAGAGVIITRPVGRGRALARRVRHMGGVPVSLPGLSLRSAPQPAQACADMQAALTCDMVIFTSPAAVSFAGALVPLQDRACLAAVGGGTARALYRRGVPQVVVPSATADSEGLLAHPVLAAPRGQQIAVVGAPGGRGVIQATLRQRGATVTDVHVYQRVPARLDARHHRALQQLPTFSYMLVSSSAALRCLQQALAPVDWQALLATHVVASSQRVAGESAAAGFARISVAASALASDMLEQTMAVHGS